MAKLRICFTRNALEPKISTSIGSASRGHTTRRPKTRQRKRSVVVWARRVLFVFLGLVLVLPVALILVLRVVPAPPTPLMIGMQISGVGISRNWVPLEAMSADIVKAVIASEDGKFCSHWGFDIEAIQDALEYNASGQGVRGASTISQQTAKNLFLPPARTWLRKGVEAYLTLLIEALWPKRRIMEVYLNIVELGEGNFGVEAAAQNYFGKSATGLSRDESARLAAVLPNPRGYRVLDPGPYVQRRTVQIANMMGNVTRDRLDGCITQYAP